MKKTFHKKGDQFDSWKLLRLIKRGGNGEVWEVENLNKEKAAIKFLKSISPKSYARFRDEIDVVKKNNEIGGLLTILDFSLPEELTGSTPWYVMPLAVPLLKHVQNESAIKIVENFISLAATLSELHVKKISHRDIKPGNLFYLNEIPCFGDFGLVEYPNKKDITHIGESVGPKWTMAPEMRRNAEKADGIPADIYSLAKTLWIFLTKQSKGFDGQYSKESINALTNFQPSIYTDPLDSLLFDCTDDSPDKRPSIKEFRDRLEKWLKANNDFNTRNPLQWKDIQRELFPSNIPSRAIWEDVETIVDILKKLSLTEDLCHVFLPTGGGNDLEDVRPSHEYRCMELDFGYTYICKPKRLIFESFSCDEEWNYFRLECSELLPTYYYSETLNGEEPLTELEPLLYTDYNCSEYNDFNGMDLPHGARLITRICTECSFVIFRKTSTYNRISATYDARHNTMTTDQFRSYIERSAKAQSKGTEMIKKQNNPINLAKPSKYKTKNKVLSLPEIDLINKVISLAKLRDIENAEINHKYPENGLILGDESINYMFESRPKEKDLEDFLKSLSKNQLTLVAAVMYGGRGASPPWGISLDRMIERIKDGNLVESISEKASLIEYLKKGIDLYS